MRVDPAIIHEALILTMIGMTTAVIVLISLLFLILLIKISIQYIPGRVVSLDTPKPGPVGEAKDGVTRDRALAAALAVTALTVSRPHASCKDD